MALDQSALREAIEALKAADVDDRVRSAAETIYQALIEAELTETIGAAPHQRTDERTTHPAGFRSDCAVWGLVSPHRAPLTRPARRA